jgi:hypothetical protein
LYGLLFFHSLQLGFKPDADTLFDNTESRITIEKDRPDQGFKGIRKDLILAIPPQALLPAAQPDEFFYPQPACNLCERDIVLKLLLLLGDASLGLDPLLHEKEDQPGFKHCIPECTVCHLIYEQRFLLEQFICKRGVGKRPDQVLFFKKMIAEYLLNFRTIVYIHT